MLEELLQAARRLGVGGPPAEAPAELVQYVPPDFRWEDVAAELVGPNGAASSRPGDAAALRALQACLAVKDVDAAGPVGEDVVQKLGQFVDRSILPIAPALPEPDDDDDEKEASQDHDDAAWPAVQAKAELGLHVLATLAGPRRDRLGPAALGAAAAYAHAAAAAVRDPWTTPAAARLARGLLDGALPLADRPADRARFLADGLLAARLRPLFACARPPAVTAAGRRAAFVDPAAAPPAVHEDPARTSWKREHRYAVAMFEWVVSASDQDILAQAWPSYTPILLTLLDAAETELKARALRIFGAFWARCPPGLMDRVGLTSVFADAVFPAVLYLPSLTPEDESLRLLDAAYPALAQLAGLSHASPPSPLQGRPADPADQKEHIITTPDLTAQQRKLLDRIVREGVMTGHFHARDYVRLTTLFCEELHLLVSGMGILATKYLKDLMPMVSNILIDPFGTQHPPALRAATKLLQAIMRCCWPRVPNYCNDIIKMLAICWLNTEEDDGSPTPLAWKLELREQLTRAAAMLGAIMGASDADTNFHDLVVPLVQKEPSLRGLLPIPSSTTD